jgi:hypothetical protein
LLLAALAGPAVAAAAQQPERDTTAQQPVSLLREVFAYEGGM